MNILDFELLDQIPDRDKAAIAGKARKKTFRRGDTIELKGTRLTHVYFIERGRVKESTCTHSGKEIVYNVFTRGECFGLAWAFNLEPSKADFVALEDSEVFVIEVGELKKLAGTQSSVLQAIFSELTRIALKYSDKLYEIRALDAPGRTRVELLRHALSRTVADDADFVEIENLPTHEEIANTIFSHREAVTKEISNLKRDGVLVKTENNLLAANIPRLQKMVAEH